MSGGSSPAVTNQVSKVELPAWVDQASQENYNLAREVSNRPYEAYGGQDVAAPSDMTTDAYARLRALANQGSNVTDIGTISRTGILDRTNPLYSQARDLFTSSAGPLDINSYLNPYTNEVEQRAIGNANTALDRQLTNVSDRANKAGAFGGSRSAVESAVTRGEGIRNIGDISAQLRSAGFDTASRLASDEMARRAGAAAGLLSTASGITGTETAQQNALINQQQQQMRLRQQDQDVATQNIGSLLSAGSKDEGQRQSVLDALKARFTEARNYPIEQLNLRLAALGMSPYGKTETTNKTATTENKGPDWATIGLGVLKTIPSLVAMSDRNTKTDITKLTDGDIPLYSYRYKDDPKTYPKVVGPMAQDIEKKYPSAIKKVGKYKTVDINNLMEVLS